MFLNLVQMFELYIRFHTIWIMLLKKILSQQKHEYFLEFAERRGKNADLHIYVAHSWPLKLKDLRSMMTLYAQ